MIPIQFACLQIFTHVEYDIILESLIKILLEKVIMLHVVVVISKATTKQLAIRLFLCFVLFPFLNTTPIICALW